MSVVCDAKSFLKETGVSRETLAKINIYAGLLEKWQKKINLVSAGTLPDIWSRHFYDSFQLGALLDQTPGKNLQILDIGSGAGFPGLLLSIVGAGRFHMVESNSKKCAFMNQVIRETDCDAVVHCKRIEDLKHFPVDYIISRACAPLDKLLGLGRHFMGSGTVCLFLKGKNADDEIEAARLKWDFILEKFTSVSEQSGIIVKVSNIKALNEVT